nr:MAG TPA: hypothetical protein [Caudoviricetes sp.]
MCNLLGSVVSPNVLIIIDNSFLTFCFSNRFLILGQFSHNYSKVTWLHVFSKKSKTKI